MSSLANVEYQAPSTPKNIRRWDSESLFLDRDFLLLWTSQVATIFGGTILGIAVGLLAGKGEFTDQGSTSSSFAMAMVLFMNNFPSFFVAFIAGVVADWYDKRKVMIISNVARMLFLGVFVVFAGWKYAVFAYAIIFFKAVAKQFFLPAEASMIPMIVKKDNIMAANSLFNLTNYVMTIIGFIIAAPMLVWFGEEGVMMILMAMFIVASISVFFVRMPREKVKKGISFEKLIDLVRGFVSSFDDGLGYIMKEKVQRIAMIQNLVSQAFVFIFMTLVFKLGEFLIGLTPDNIGVLSVLPLGVGIVIGVGLINTIFVKMKRMKLTLAGVWMQGMGFFVLSIASMLKWNGIELFGLGTGDLVTMVSIVAAVIIGIGFPFLFIPSQALVQEETEEGFVGRVYGVWFALSQALATIPAVIVGYFADYYVGIPTTLVWTTIIIFAYSIFVYNNRNLA